VELQAVGSVGGDGRVFFCVAVLSVRVCLCESLLVCGNVFGG